MVQTENLPNVPKAPAPWQLKGNGYILAVKLPAAQLDQESFTPDYLQGTRRGRMAYVMFVDYQSSDAGPYQELLYIPGSFQFKDARRLSITKIYVSTWDSVVNGHDNWGIPKERCDFSVTRGADADHVTLHDEQGNTFAELSFSEMLFPIPVNTRWAPKGLRTLSQYWKGQQFTFTPEAKGHIKPARLLSARFNPAMFPDLAQGKVMACFKVTDFEMVFPVSSITAA